MDAGLITTLASCVAVMVLVAWISWRKTRGSVETRDGYFLAGRGLTAGFIAGSLLLTNLSAEQMIGLNGSAYGHNLSSMAWEVTAAIATVAMAFLFLPRYLAGAFTTLPEFLAERFDPGVRRMSVVLFMLGYGLVTIPSVLYSGSLAVLRFFDVPALTGLPLFPALGLTGPFIAFAAVGIATLIALRLRLPNDTPQFPARGSAYAAPYSTTSPEQGDSGDDTDAVSLTEPGKRMSGWRDPRTRPWVVSGLIGGHAQAMVLGISGFLVLDRLGLRETPELGAGPVGIVLMCGAIATLLAQWGIIPNFHLGPRAASMSGIVISAIGTAFLAIADDLHSIALAYSIATLGFGLFRPGNNAGASLAVDTHEQGEVAGVMASIAGAAFIVAPALGVWLYNTHESFAFGSIIGLCAIVVIYGWSRLGNDDEMTSED